MKKYFYSTTPLQQLLLLIILTLSLWILISVFAIAVAVLFWGSEVLSNMNVLMANSTFLKFFQVFQSIGLFILPPVFFEWLTKGVFLPRHRTLGKNTGIYLILSVLVVVAAQPFITFLGVINHALVLPDYLANLEEWMRQKEAAAQQITEIFLVSTHWSHHIINVVIIAVLPAIGEELMFRGALQRVFHAIFKNVHWAVFFTAALFSAIHIQFFGFLPRFVLGLIFGYLMVFSGNIWLPILAHFTNNFMAFLVYQWYMSDNQTASNPLEAGSEYPDVFWVVTSAVVITLSLLLCKRLNNKVASEAQR
ncbi:hypothetical protein SAMN06265379_103440 [Saccharicrinis carchari]|uniref:CAAX prenyl protease 2/Lysostaphin resistance protein A-like domain-containing protein n=1 Tax=Saccharicrinis carchari TaxID=1168039 RepID=A0A521CUX5_SACCC|nr:CPBP family intramembrane glutamic endopeptidase [Saccharicrinis carchari]SMO62460.1 hypothetical protein SAMN06265379_103440 [Saccharicrinis carchari]